MVRTSLIRQSRLKELWKSSDIFKISVGWIVLVGISISCFKVAKENALEARKEHLRLKKELPQKIAEEFEDSKK